MIALKKGKTPNWVLSNEATETAKYQDWTNRAKGAGTKNAGAEPSPWSREDIKQALIDESNGGNASTANHMFCTSRSETLSTTDLKVCFLKTS
jgi:hypothetical protein